MYIYKLLDSTNTILYIGKSNDDPCGRINCHKEEKEWSSEISTFEITKFEEINERALREIETLLIKTLKPLYNICDSSVELKTLKGDIQEINDDLKFDGIKIRKGDCETTKQCAINLVEYIKGKTNTSNISEITGFINCNINSFLIVTHGRRLTIELLMEIYNCERRTAIRKLKIFNKNAGLIKFSTKELEIIKYIQYNNIIEDKEVLVLFALATNINKVKIMTADALSNYTKLSTTSIKRTLSNHFEKVIIPLGFKKGSATHYEIKKELI